MAHSDGVPVWGALAEVVARGSGAGELGDTGFHAGGARSGGQDWVCARSTVTQSEAVTPGSPP